MLAEAELRAIEVFYEGMPPRTDGAPCALVLLLVRELREAYDGEAIQKSHEGAQRASRDPELMALAWSKIREKRSAPASPQPDTGET